jgi:anti-sigma factor RsiW
MSRPHVPQPLLEQFVEGTVDEKVAVAVALHLDACPACSTRAASLEPLAAAFAAVDDPGVPVGLVEQIGRALRESDRPGPEPLLAGLFLALAAIAFLVGGSPGDVWSQAATLWSALRTVTGALFGESLLLAPMWFVSAAIALAAAVLFARSLERQRIV